MLIEVNHKKITDSPYCISSDNNYVTNHDYEIEQSTQEILLGNPTSYLISGYRGSGKTSLIKKIEEKLSGKVFFAYCNFSKYENHEIVLRKLIRSLFHAVKDSKYNNELKSKLNNLYVRTFYDIQNKHSFTKIKSNKNIIDIKLDKKNILLLIMLILNIFNIKFDFITKIFDSNSNLILLILNIFLLFIKNINFKAIYEKITKKESKYIASELFDNDIAEHQLLSVLQLAKSNNTHFTIVLDEIDKIDNSQEILSLINELKPLMLSGLCNFIIIAGQQFFYQVKKSQILDDSSLSSLFSKVIHTKVFTKNDFYTLFKSYVNENLIDELLYNFVDSIILQSNRLPRKFINLIRQNIVWENNKAYLNIPEDKSKVYSNDSIILSIIEKLEENTIEQMNYSVAIKDFFVVQLHIWIHKMKLIGNDYKVDDIFDFEDYQRLHYPKEAIIELPNILNVLIENLCDNKLLIRETQTIDDEDVLIYKWEEEASIIDDNSREFKQPQKYIMLEAYSEFESIIRRISNEIFKNTNTKTQGLKQLFKKLLDIDVLDKRKYNIQKIYESNHIRNKIVHGDNNYDISDVMYQEYRFHINRSKLFIYEDYTYYISKKILKDFNFNVERGDIKSNFDYYAISSIDNRLKINFEVKLGMLNHDQIIKLVTKIKNNIAVSVEEQFTYYVLYIYENKLRNTDKNIIESRINDILNNEKLDDRVFVMSVPMREEQFSTKRFLEHTNFMIESIRSFDGIKI